MDKDTGTITALMERLEKQRLLRILALKEKVDNGETLNETNLDFLEKVFSDAKYVMLLLVRNPEYQSLAMKILGLYKEITEKALQLERNSA